MAFKSYRDSEEKWQKMRTENYERNSRERGCYNCLHCRKYKGRYYCDNDDSFRYSTYYCNFFTPSPYSSPMEIYD